MAKVNDLKNLKIGKLLVIEKVEPPKQDKEQRAWWKCRCDCGKETIKRGKDLASGKIKSCGCSQGFSKITPNKFVIDGNVTYIYIKNKDNPVLIDSEDYDKVKMYRWQNNRNYAMTQVVINGNKKHISLHSLIIPNNNKDLEIDHINGNPSDNRKCNLRLVTHIQNCWNRKVNRLNNSGKTGVRLNSKSDSWEAYINFKNNHISLGFFKTKEEAIKTRKIAEEKYFGEYKRTY